MINRSEDYYKSLVRTLCKLPTEVEWVEFKCNNADPERIAKYISGLSNVATLEEEPYAYLIWGVEDETHEIIGTEFFYRKAKKGNEELESWLTRMINPKINFRFVEVDMDEGKTVTVLEIPSAEKEPTKYESVAYIRVGSNLKPLVGYKEKEAGLWRMFDQIPYEMKVAAGELSEDEVANLLDYPEYYKILDMPIPANREKVMQDLSDERFVKQNSAGSWDITNLGALLIAKDMRKFEGLVKKTVRIVRYQDTTRVDGISEKEFSNGYAIAFDKMKEYILTVIPQREILENGSERRQVYGFPEAAIRELLANLLIHQDLAQKGTNPMVEIFSDRIEFSNAGAPLIAIERIVDTVPRSRNEKIARFMHRCGICDERGSGYDKIIMATNKDGLIAPKVVNQENQFTRVTLYSKVPFDLISKDNKVWTCYMSACLAYVNSGSITNPDIRAIFGIGDDNKPKASRIIKDTLKSGLIKPIDPDTAPRYMRYIPFWA